MPAMEFTREQLLRLSQWEPLHPDFDRNGGIVERQLVQDVIEPFLGDLHQKNFACTVVEDGGLTNYYAVWVRKTVKPAEVRGVAYFTVPGVTVYLSLLGPFAAVGKVAGDYFSRMHYFNLERTIDPTSDLSDLESVIVESLSKTRYAILTPTDLAQRVPDDIKPYDCFFPGPYTLFDMLFANTD